MSNVTSEEIESQWSLVAQLKYAKELSACSNTSHSTMYNPSKIIDSEALDHKSGMTSLFSSYQVRSGYDNIQVIDKSYSLVSSKVLCRFHLPCPFFPGFRDEECDRRGHEAQGLYILDISPHTAATASQSLPPCHDSITN